MRWEDERYVRLYNRDSATWAMLPWQGRCLLPLLLRKVDRAGLLEVVNGEEAQAVATLVNVPIEVVEVGLAALKTRGVVTIRGGELRLPTFLAAQTAKQSDKLRQEKSRELAALGKPLSHAVTSGHTESHDVTPSLAVLSRDVTSLAVPKFPLAQKRSRVPRAPKIEAPTDARHAPLVKDLVNAFESKRGAKYPFTPRSAAEVSRLLATGMTPEVIGQAWIRALTHIGFPSVSTFGELATNLPHFIGAGTQKTEAKGAAWTQAGATEWTEEALNADPYEMLKRGLK